MSYKKGEEMKEAIIKFRAKLTKDRRNLKWFHEDYVGKMYEYGYFIKQICYPYSVKDDLAAVIKKYVGE